MNDEKPLGGLLGPNPLAEYMAQRAAGYDQNRQAAQAAQNWSGAAGAAGIATGNPALMIGGGFGALVAQLMKIGYGRQQAEAIAAEKMWGNTGLPGMPER